MQSRWRETDPVSLEQMANINRQRRHDLVARVIDGETVILDLAGGCIHQLNDTASHIWDQCDGIRSAEEIAWSIATHFHAAPDVVLEDVITTLREFDRLGLLTSAPKPINETESPHERS